MKVQDKKWIRFRIYIVAFFFLAGLLTVMARAFQLQVIDRDRLDAIARAGYEGVIKLPPKRGTIYDREGHELAVSVDVKSVYAHPKLIKDKNRTAGLLALNLDGKKSSILGLLKKDRSFVWIKRRISPEKGRQIKNLDLEGIFLTTETRRYYPGRDIAGHLLGFSGSDNQGLEGLEKRVDSGEMAAAFSMYATSMEDLMLVADANEVMPPKSTWFEPKLRSGLVIHKLD